MATPDFSTVDFPRTRVWTKYTVGVHFPLNERHVRQLTTGEEERRARKQKRVEGAVLRMIRAYVRRENGIHGPVTVKIDQDFMTGVFYLTGRARCFKDVPEEKRAMLQPALDRKNGDCVVELLSIGRRWADGDT